MKRELKVAVMGYGTVGRGVCEILCEKRELLAARSDVDEVSLQYVLDIKDLTGEPVEALWVRSVDTIVSDPSVNVVVETMGGTEPAFTFCMKCLNAGKNVITSNKQLVAEKGEALFQAARANNVSFRFGAAVCGGIPVLRTTVYGLAANRMRSFCGILNGTTNFILSKMINENMSFAAALKLAQENGYAEADPAADVDGHDACRKTAILCAIMFGGHVYPDEISTEGISKITLEDVAYVNDFGGKIKLLGRGKQLEDGSVCAMVSPAVIRNDSMLANVEGVYNAVLLHGDKIGTVMLYGQGAGKDATASAVVADILDCGRKPGFDTAYSWEAADKKRMADPDEQTLRLYVRGFANQENTLSELRESFGSLTVLHRENAPGNEIAFITDEDKEKALTEQLRQVKSFAAASVIRLVSET